MQGRERWLAIGLGTAVVLWFGADWISSSVFGPIRNKREQLQTARDKRDGNEAQILRIARSRQEHNQWLARSLPPDPTPAGRGPAAPRVGSGRNVQIGAITAQRLYHQWVQELAELCQLESLSVRTDRQPTRNSVFAMVPIVVQGEATHANLVRFLRLFRRTALMHRLVRVQIASPQPDGDPLLKLTLEVEGMVMAGAAPRQFLFPRTELSDNITSDQLTLGVANVQDFPKNTGWLVRIDRELIRVTARSETTWTIERGAEGTIAADHAAEAIVEHFPLDPPRADDDDERLNLFAKPTPPIQYKLEVEAPGSPTVMRGAPLDVTLKARGFNPALGAVRYALKSPPAGAALDAATGKLTWTPPSDAPAGTVSIAYEAWQVQAPDVRATGVLKVAVTIPNEPPSVQPVASQSAYLGREWSVPLVVTDDHTCANQLKYALAGEVPRGASVSPEGVVRWLVEESVPLGNKSLEVVVTDDGTPPQSTTVRIPLVIADDLPRFTVLVGIVAVNGQSEAWLYDRSRGVKTVVRAGDPLVVGDVRGRVEAIDASSVTVALESTPVVNTAADPATLDPSGNGASASPPPPALTRTIKVGESLSVLRTADTRAAALPRS